MGQKPELSIIIPSVGRKEILNRTLTGVIDAVQNYNIEIILVDDSKTGIELEVLFPVKIIRTGGKGASFARNEGWKVAESDLLLFLDDDILIDQKHIQRTLFLHKFSQGRAYNFFWIYPPDLMQKLNSTKFGKYIVRHKLYSNEHRLDPNTLIVEGMSEEKGLTSQYFSISKRFIEQVGGYDPIPYAGVEDLLLYKKLNGIGVPVFLSHEDIVFQDESNRLHVDSLVSRYRTGALTRRVAVGLGHPEMGVKMSHLQRTKGKMAWALEPLAKTLNMLFPYGRIYEKAVNLRLFIATYRGYYLDKVP